MQRSVFVVTENDSASIGATAATSESDDKLYAPNRNSRARN